VDILYSIQLYDTGLDPKMFAPLTTDPAVWVAAWGTPLVGAGDALVVVIPVAGAAGLVLEHPAIAMAITTNMIARILIREIFIISSGYDGHSRQPPRDREK
jgi:hypothetical protein